MYPGLFARNFSPIVKHYKIYQYSTIHSTIEKGIEELKESKCKTHRLDQCPNLSGKVTREEALILFNQMTLIRRLETICGLLYQHSYITGFCHLYSGQEACAVGIHSILRPQDTCITSYRCHGWALLRLGATEEGIIAILKELTGRKTGLCAGKSGSMHLFLKNFYGGNGVVGAQVSLGTGLGFAHKYANDGGITFTILGDGAMNNGQIFESFNLAKLQNLPIVYVIENNNYGMGTSVARSSSNPELYKKGDMIPGIRVSGMDVTIVRDTTKFVVQHVLDGKGPIIMELLTYRYSGHSVADPGTSYRNREDVKRVKDKYGPINILRKKIYGEKLATKDELKDILKNNKDLVERAVQIALNDAEPPLSDLVTTICAQYDTEVRVPSSLL